MNDELKKLRQDNERLLTQIDESKLELKNNKRLIENVRNNNNDLLIF